MIQIQRAGLVVGSSPRCAFSAGEAQFGGTASNKELEARANQTDARVTTLESRLNQSLLDLQQQIEASQQELRTLRGQIEEARHELETRATAAARPLRRP